MQLQQFIENSETCCDLPSEIHAAANLAARFGSQCSSFVPHWTVPRGLRGWTTVRLPWIQCRNSGPSYIEDSWKRSGRTLWIVRDGYFFVNWGRREPQQILTMSNLRSRDRSESSLVTSSPRKRSNRSSPKRTTKMGPRTLGRHWEKHHSSEQVKHRRETEPLHNITTKLFTGVQVMSTCMSTIRPSTQCNT